MTQEQKEKLEQKAKDYIKPFAHQLHLGADEGLIMDLVGFAQTILDNPGEWGLVPKAQHDHYMAKYTSLVEWYDKLMGTPCEQVRHQQEIESLQAQNERYREALESIANAEDLGIEVDPLGIALLMKKRAKEALKNIEK